jgi:hypothetical protein
LAPLRIKHEDHRTSPRWGTYLSVHDDAADLLQGQSQALEEQRKTIAAYYKNLSDAELAHQVEEVKIAMEYAKTRQEQVNALLATEAASRWPLWLSLVVIGGQLAFSFSPALLAAYALPRAATAATAIIAAIHAYDDITDMISALREGAGINVVALSSTLGRKMLERKLKSPNVEFVRKLTDEFHNAGMHIVES